MVAIISSILLLIGVVFVFVGAIGVLRMQDVFIRMSASTKTTILGTGFMLLSVIVFFNDVAITGEAIAIFVFLLATAPVSAHMIGRAAYSDKVPLWEKTEIDELAGKYDDDSQVLASGLEAGADQSDTWQPAILDDHVL